VSLLFDNERQDTPGGFGLLVSIVMEDCPEQSCDCRRVTLVLEMGDTHASAYCEKCKHDVWLGREIPEGPATRRGARVRRPGEDAVGLVDDGKPTTIREP
jgi:hypothetical protein